MRTVLQHPFAAPAAGVALVAAAGVVVLDPGRVDGPRAVLWTADVVFALWAVGTGLMLRSAPGGTAISIVWPAGALALVLHVVAAFRYRHGWSLFAAYEHTAEVGGFGPGLYVNFVVTAGWLADAAMAVGWNRAVRARTVFRGVLAFVMFNAAVVFAPAPLRWVGAGVFVVLAVVWRMATRPPWPRP